MAAKSDRSRKRPSARAALLDAAVAEFTSKGYASATLAGIAARAGVTTGAVYSHFRSKLELLLEAIGRDTVEAFTRRSEALGNRPAPAMALGLARGLVGTPAGRRDQLLIDAIVFARRDAKVAAAYRRLIRSHLEAFEQTANRGREAGRIDPALPVDELARLVLALAFGVLALRALEEPPPSDASVARVVEQLLRPTGAGEAVEASALARVQLRATALEHANAELRAAIAQAAAEGHSLRKIGDAAGLSHERIRRILAES